MVNESEIKELEAKLAALKATPAPTTLKLDLGCGIRKQPGFYGVDAKQFDGVDLVFDLTEKWPWADGSVDEIYSSHFIEHLTWPERVHFFNEACRVLKKGGKATIVWPHWCSDRYWGDPTHKAPMSAFGIFYLNAEWRKVNAPHVDYTCDFDFTVAYSLASWMQGRSTEFQQFAMVAYKEAAQDIQATLTKR